ncbi:hypothetical protein CEE45_12260 [Candidatus Heimdallarchaeota archaeon B3_Heim]|nr:MAG: hypothetical protein CEE45_12260 [Candidatus Heimdallarchaeota archaeon B3_Heim]
MNKKKNSSKEEKQLKKVKKRKKQINFLLTEEQENVLDDLVEEYSRNRTDFFVTAINFFKHNPELYGRGKVAIPTESITKKDLEELETNLFERLQYQIQTLQMMTQSIVDREETEEKQEKLTEIEQTLFNFKGLKRLDTYDKIEGFLTKQFPQWETELTVEKIYYDLVIKFLQQGDVIYNTRTKKLKWSVSTDD